MQTNMQFVYLCLVNQQYIFFISEIVLIQWNTIYEALYSQPEWTQHICKTIHNNMVNRPRTRNPFSKSLTWFNWFTDNKNIISSVHRPNNTHLKSQVDYGRTMLHIAHIPLQKRGKGGAYVDIIRLRSMTY